LSSTSLPFWSFFPIRILLSLILCSGQSALAVSIKMWCPNCGWPEGTCDFTPWQRRRQQQGQGALPKPSQETPEAKRARQAQQRQHDAGGISRGQSAGRATASTQGGSNLTRPQAPAPITASTTPATRSPATQTPPMRSSPASSTSQQMYCSATARNTSPPRASSASAARPQTTSSPAARAKGGTPVARDGSTGIHAVGATTAERKDDGQRTIKISLIAQTTIRPRRHTDYRASMNSFLEHVSQVHNSEKAPPYPSMDLARYPTDYDKSKWRLLHIANHDIGPTSRSIRK
jgi:hypothetical protein